jgi:hypothetical protein
MLTKKGKFLFVLNRYKFSQAHAVKDAKIK